MLERLFCRPCYVSQLNGFLRLSALFLTNHRLALATGREPVADPPLAARQHMWSANSEDLPNQQDFQQWHSFQGWNHTRALRELITRCLRYTSEDRPTPSALVTTISNLINRHYQTWESAWQTTPDSIRLQYDQFRWRVGGSAAGWEVAGARTRQG